MPVNANRPERWKTDIAKSVDYYNNWFMQFAPEAYRQTRVATTKQVQQALQKTINLTHITTSILRENPNLLSILRMVTAPPIARDRLIGLASVSSNLVKSMEIQNRIPPRMDSAQINTQIHKIGQVIKKLIDSELFPWLQTGTQPTVEEVYRAATVVADRLCNAVTNPIIRNAQEQRQLKTIRKWLEKRNYTYIEENRGLTIKTMKPGTFAFRLNVPVTQPGRTKATNLPIDLVVVPKQKMLSDFPLLIEAKSAGDFANTNKRRKEEATKIAQLHETYGKQIKLVLFLCGYFDSGYLGYEAAEGLDWVWEHRIDDLAEFGI